MEIEELEKELPRFWVDNPETDKKTATLILKTLKLVTTHWLEIMPIIKVIIATDQFNRVPDLKGFCALKCHKGLKGSGWRWVQVACTEFDSCIAIFWVHYNQESPICPPESYFQKELLKVVAQLLWGSSENLQLKVKRLRPDLLKFGPGAPYVAFRDTFPNFFLNPKYLQEYKEAAWEFMENLDGQLRDKK